MDRALFGRTLECVCARFKLQFGEACIDTVTLDQRLVRALLDDTTVLHDENAVRT